MILSYKQQFPWGKPTNFEAKVKSGKKKHTIRDDVHNRWRPNMKIHHAQGVRTKSYRCFGEGKCVSTQVIEIEEMIMMASENCYIYREQVFINERMVEFIKLFRVKVDGRLLTNAEMVLLARNDGFETAHDFFRWFNKPFKGKIIHWTSFKY